MEDFHPDHLHRANAGHAWPTCAISEPDRTDQNVSAVQAALASLYERYAADIYSYLLARTGNADDAADLTHGVFIRVMPALPRYESRGAPIAAWLFRIARNMAIDLHRRWRPTTSWDILPEALHPAVAADMDSRAIERERLTRLLELVAALDEPKRELVLLRFAGGLKIREMSAVLDRSEAAIKTDLGRILRGLKEQYGDD